MIGCTLLWSWRGKHASFVCFVVLVLIGNKIDLESCRQVSIETADAYAASIGAIHLQTSAATGVGELCVCVCTRVCGHVFY